MHLFSLPKQLSSAHNGLHLIALKILAAVLLLGEVKFDGSNTHAAVSSQPPMLAKLLGVTVRCRIFQSLSAIEFAA